MGNPQSAPAFGPEVLEGFRQRLAGLEALGIDTARLKEILEEDPASFEAAAEEALRRELSGGEVSQGPAPVPEAPTPSAPQEPAAPETPPPAPLESAVEWPAREAPAPELAETIAAETSDSTSTTPAAQSPELDEISELERKLAQALEAPPIAEPAPAQTSKEPPAPDPVEVGAAEVGLDAELVRFLGSEMEVEPAPPPPPLAEGDSLSMGAPSPARVPPARPASPGAKPRPPAAPGGAARQVAPASERVVVRSSFTPPGAKPTSTGGGEVAEAVEVLPVKRRSAGAVAALAVLLVAILVFSLVYFVFGNAAPLADFTLSNGPYTAGEPIAFNGSISSDPNQDPLIYTWDFGDGLNESGPSAIHTYAHSGDYTVALTVKDNEGARGSKSATLEVNPGTIAPPVYRYGDGLDSTVAGNSRVTALDGNALATFTVSLGTLGDQTVHVTQVNLSYTGTQRRSIDSAETTVKNGFLEENTTYADNRSLDLNLNGVIKHDFTAYSDLQYSGTSQAFEREFSNLESNDTVRRESNEDTHVTITNAQPPRELQSSARLIDYPSLKNAADQMHLEKIYAGRSFNTEHVANGTLRKDGYNWTWITQGTELVDGYLAVKINLTATDRPPSVTQFYIVLWVASASPFPLKELYYARGIETGRSYESLFTSTATGVPSAGVADIPFGNRVSIYPPVDPSKLATLGAVPRSTVGGDFAFTPQTAYDEATADADFASFVANFPNAYAVNGNYSSSAGNPKWTLDFSQDKTSERKRVEDEHSGPSTQFRIFEGNVAAERTRSQVGHVISLNGAVSLLTLEDQATALFPSGTFDRAHANFTIRQALKPPSLSFNAAGAATRQATPYAFGAESLDSEPTRVSAYVDAQTGQILFSLWETGDSLS